MLIALTGGIASGKSTVAEVWRELGAEVIDADDIAREVVAANTLGLRLVAERFGPGVISEDGTLNRTALGQIVFGDSNARHHLERILHPLIRERSTALFKTAAAEHVVYAIPLLVESGGDYSFDRVCTVSAPVETRVSRLVKFRNLSESEARKRVLVQATDAQREAVADVIIDSNCSLEELRQRAKEAWHELLTLGGDVARGA